MDAITNQWRRWLCGVLPLIALASSLLFSPLVSAQCAAASDTGTGKVLFRSCTEVSSTSRATNLLVPYPSGINAGDVLIVAATVKRGVGYQIPSGWVRMMEETSTGLTLVIFRRIADGSESGSLFIEWTGPYHAQALMMRFTGATGRVEIDFDNTGPASATPQAPSITPPYSNFLALRVGAFNAEAFDFSSPGVISSDGLHADIDRETAPTPGVSPTTAVSLAAAYRNFTSGGNSGTATFNVQNSIGYLSATIAIEYGAAGTTTAQSPGPSCAREADSILDASQIIVFEGCKQATRAATDAFELSIVRPGLASTGGLLVAMISVGGTDVLTPPAGWSTVFYSTHKESAVGDPGASFGVYSKLTSASEPSSYTWTLPSGKSMAGFISRFSNTAGTVSATTRIETGKSMLTPDVSTTIANSIVIRALGAHDQDMAYDPAEIIPYYRNIMTLASQRVDAGVSLQAAYTNVPASGAVRSERMYNRQVEESTLATLIIPPSIDYQLRFSMPDSGSEVCGTQPVTLTITDDSGNVITNFDGEVSLSITTPSASNSVGAQWLDLDSSLNGTLVGGANGNATYTFNASDNGVAVFDFHNPNATTVNFNGSYYNAAQDDTYTEPAGFDPILTVSTNCELRIEHDGAAGNCGIESITLTLVDAAGTRAYAYVGTVAFTSGSSDGNFSIVSGAGTLSPVPDADNNGAVSYTFDNGDNAQVTLGYSRVLSGTVNFNATDTTNGFVTDTDLPASYDADLVISACEVRVIVEDASDEGDMCSIAQITIAITTSAGAAVSNYTGSLTLATDTANGDWRGGGVNTVVNGTADDGAATYAFASADGGDVTLGFTHLYETTPGSPLGFVVSSTSANGATLVQSTIIDEEIDILGCTADVQVDDGIASTCAAGEEVTYTIRDRDGNVANNFEGYLVLDADTGKGDYVPNGENGTFNNSIANDGAALYQYDLADAGSLTVTYSSENEGIVNLTGSAPSITLDSGSDGEIDFRGCEFRIGYPDASPASGDLCTVETISIGLYDYTGNLATNYSGVINISASSGLGTWSEVSADGVLNNPFAGDGNANYTFDLLDGGEVQLGYLASGAGTVNFDVSDGVSADPGDSGDPHDTNLTIVGCNFKISYDGGSTYTAASVTACSLQEVTIEIINSAGVVQTDYTGLVTISTSTNHGAWSVSDADGTLTATGASDSGNATYQFVDSDNGEITLNFGSSLLGDVNMDVTEGDNSVDSAADPTLTITGCVPTVSTPQCSSDPLKTADIAITARNSDPLLRGRLIVMVIGYSATTNVSSATFNGVAMTRIERARKTSGVPATVDMWGLLDADLPVAAGIYTGEYVGGSNGPAMCFMFLEGVEQTFPIYNSGAPSEGAVNTSTGTENTATTPITTPSNNSVVVSGVLGGESGGTTRDYTSVAPAELNRSFQGPDAIASDFAGSSGVIGTAAAIDVIEVRNGSSSNRHAHVAAAFGPLLDSPPTITDYVALSLRKSFSGNIGFKAFGNTLRTGEGSAAGCVMRTDAVPATLSLPGAGTLSAPNSSIIAARLYWFGSGDFNAQPSGADFDTVNFRQPDLTVTSIDAEGVYLATSAFKPPSGKSYYAAYRDVTSLVTTQGEYALSGIDSAVSAPWSSDQQCIAGWSMVVVYSNEREQQKTVNIYDGLHPIRGSISTPELATLAMTNFRVSSTNTVGNLPNGQLAFIMLEGDIANRTGRESYIIQPEPASTDFNVLTNYYSLPYAAFNATISRPILSIQDLDPGAGVANFYSIDTASGRDGYEVDFSGSFTGANPDAASQTGVSYGLDIDTFHLSPDGAEAGYLFDTTTAASVKGLAEFGDVNAGSITAGAASGDDAALVLAQVLAITSEPVADLEITLSERGSYKIGGSGLVDIDIQNNGSGAIDFGSATGLVTVTGLLPAGLTFANTSAVSGDEWSCVVTTTPSAFTCEFNISADWDSALGAVVDGELGETGVSGVGESLPTLTATFDIADSSTFELDTNRLFVAARLLHSDGTCAVASTGVSPNPAGCEPAQFDNVNFLDNGAIDINDLSVKTETNNNVDTLELAVVGLVADLRMVKLLQSPLNKTTGFGIYTLRVTNLGPDETSAQFTVTDNLPASLGLSSVIGTDFSCTSALQIVTCVLNSGVTLALNESVDITLTVSVLGDIGELAYNTARVAPSLGNVDDDMSNNFSTLVSPIISDVPIVQEKYLISVSTLESGSRGQSKLAALSGFNDDDLILYDPQTDTATMFFNDTTGTSQISVTDINAAHLLPNGHIVMSNSGTSSATGLGSFGPEDIIQYDPIKEVSTRVFDGSEIFTSGAEDIDAVYVLDNGDFVFSTTSAAAIGSTSWDKSDLIRYSVGSGTASIYIDGSDAQVFGAADLVQVAGVYIRVSPSDATAVIDTHNFTSSDDFARIGVGGEPVLGTVATKDDIGQLNRQIGSDTNYQSQNVFLGNSNPGVFSSVGSPNRDAARTIDAIHVVEEGYIGHFAISQSEAGSVCEVGKIKITKHLGTSHSADTDYYSSVRISTSTGTGNWGLVAGGGTLDNGTSDDGAAVYTFVAGDDGVVELSLEITTVTSELNVNVTNGIASESPSEDPDFNFNTVTTSIQYLDEFTTAAKNNNNGSANWSGDWVEVDDAGGESGSNSGNGVAVGDVRIGSGVITLASSPTAAGGRDPSLHRSADLSLFTITEAVNLEYDFAYTSANATDSVIVEASDDGTNWTTLVNYSGLSGTASLASAATIRLDTFGGSLDDFTGELSVRFRVANGYTSGGSFSIDNVELTTATTDCGLVSLDHYAISHAGTGISCLGSTVTIIGHDASHNPVAVPLGEVMTLSNNRLKGSWVSVVSGAGVLTDVTSPAGTAANKDGQGSYAWSGTEDTIQLLFNYTAPDSDPESVNFELGGSFFEDETTVGHDENLLISQSGLRFFDVTNAVEGIPTQLSGKASNEGFGSAVIHLQAIKSADDNPSACVALIPDGEIVEFQFAAECTNPSSCASTVPAQTFAVNGTSLGTALQNTNGVAGASAYTSVDLTFETAALGTAAPIVVEYSDAGSIQLHARYNVPLGSDPDGLLSFDYLIGSDVFVVRPFGFDIDFADDRSSDTDVSRAEDSDGSVYRKAGANFATTLTAQRWQAADDSNNDGIPDDDADLSNNGTTPNYGNETGSIEADAVVTHALQVPVAAIGSRDGVLTGGAAFTAFTGAVSTSDLSFGEVGIIELVANLADNDYLGSGQDIQGNVQKVGRFTPNHFTLSAPSISAACTPATDFTYMGERFPVSFILEARNASGAITENYINGFVKLPATRFAPDSVFHGVEDNSAAPDIDYSSRVQSIDAAFSVDFEDFGESAPGTGSIMGTLVFNRENDGLGVDGAPDGPFILRIGTSITDSDAIGINLLSTDIDVDDGVTEPGSSVYTNLTTTPILFRYGRLLLDNAFGPETEDLEIPVRIEFFDGTEFVLNTDDSCTTLTYSVSSPPLTLVTDSYKSPAGTVSPLESGDTVIEEGITTNFTVTLAGGKTGDTNIVSVGSDPDRPFSASAPSGGEVGSAIVELDLGYSSATDPVDFLTYDWRGGTSSTNPYEQEVPDGANFTNNPRAIIEFGSYRAHDRVLSWRELYVMPAE